MKRKKVSALQGSAKILDMMMILCVDSPCHGVAGFSLPR